MRWTRLAARMSRSAAQVLDQRELQRARPRPELADRERRDRLERGDEALQPLRVEAAGAATDQLERQRVDARRPGELVGRDGRKPPEERRRQIVVDVARRRRDDVEVVEQPLGRGRGRLAAPGVLGQRGVDVAQRRRWSSSRFRCARPWPRVRRSREKRAASRLAWSSNIGMPSSSMPSNSTPSAGDPVKEL